MEIKCIQDIEECKKIWEELSPKKTIYDEWEFRFCFYKYSNYKPYFYIGIIDNKIIGVLPLQYNTDKKRLEFLGGSYMDINHIFIEEKNYKFIPDFYKSLDLPAKLIVTQKDSFTLSLPQDNFNYFFNLRGINSFEELLKKLFSKKTQNTFKRKIKKIEQGKITILKDRHEDLDILINLNIKQFGDSSSFHFPNRKKIVKDLLKLPFRFVMMSFLVNGKKEAVTLSVQYKKIFYYLMSGVNPEISDLGNYVIIKNIDEATILNTNIFDIGSDDCGWKERWHAEKSMPQYLFSNIE